MFECACGECEMCVAFQDYVAWLGATVVWGATNEEAMRAVARDRATRAASREERTRELVQAWGDAGK